MVDNPELSWEENRARDLAWDNMGLEGRVEELEEENERLKVQIEELNQKMQSEIEWRDADIRMMNDEIRDLERGNRHG